MMKLKYFTYIIILITLNSCINKIDSDKIEVVNGLYIDSLTQQPLDGKYKSVSPIGGTYSGDHVSTFEYKNGIPIGEWEYTFNGDPIHSGKYLVEQDIKREIKSITQAQRVDMDLWEEGGYWMLDINLIYPRLSDTTTIKNMTEKINVDLKEKYPYNSIEVYSITDTEKEKLYWISLDKKSG